MKKKILAFLLAYMLAAGMTMKYYVRVCAYATSARRKSRETGAK